MRRVLKAPVAEAYEGAALQAAKDGKTVGEITKLVLYEEARLTRYSVTKSSIVIAAREGNINAVARLLQAGADFTARDGQFCSYSQSHTPLRHADYGDSALKAAVDGGHLEVLQRLLDTENDITSVPGFYSVNALKAAVETDSHQEVVRLQKAAKTLERAAENKHAALISATIVGNPQMMLSLINAGTNVNDSLLAIASEAGHLDVVELILQIVENGDRRQAIKAAVAAGHGEIFERLVRDMVEVDSTSLTNALGSSVFNGNESIIRRLLDLGADANARYLHQWTDIQWGLQHEGWQYHEWTALQLAALRDNIDITDTLLNAGADVNACTDSEKRGFSALHVAAEHGSVALVQLLLAAGANVNVPCSDWGCTALQSACKGGNDEIVRVLLNAGAITDTDSTIPQGHSTSIKSGLEYAAMRGHETVVGTLLESLDENLTNNIRLKALVEAVNSNHMTIAKRLLATNVLFSSNTKTRRLLPGAAKAGDLDMVRMLLEAPTNNKMPDTDMGFSRRYSDNALMFAVEHGHLEVVKLLLAAGLDVNEVHGRAEPALQIAAAKGNMLITQLLLDSGADLTATSYAGTTALQVAERSGETEIVKLLKNHQSHGIVVNRADRAHKVLQQLQSERISLCPRCSRISLEVFMGKREMRHWHNSLTSLQSSVQTGCPFCSFFWRQLDIQNIDIPQPSRVPLYCNHSNDTIWSQIDEPHPQDVERPKSIRADFHVITSPFKRKRRPITGDTASPETFQQIRSWLKRCTRGHRKCQLETDGKDAFLPTRLIDISQISGRTHIKLVETRTISHENTRYIALSHCWGGLMEDSAKLTQATLESRLTSILAASLPLTFQHLIQVAEKLRVRYVWIDSLCIIQDSANDWDRESSSMTSVYSHAYCTVAASASKNGTEGLFRNAGLSIHDSVHIHSSSEDGRSRAIIAMKEQDPWESMYYSGFLHQRGWVLQERELSPRVLHFTSSQVLWECRTFKATEGWPHSNYPAGKYRGLPPRILDTIQPENKQKIFDAWHSLVTDYSARSLTKDSDKLVALSGIARLISKYTNCEYFAGIWADDILRSLCWKVEPVDSAEARRRTEYVCPSWSWASAMGPVEFTRAKSSFTARRQRSDSILDAQAPTTLNAVVASIKDVQCAVATDNLFGQLVGGRLEITAGIIRAVVNGIDLNDFSGKTYIGEMRPDDRSEVEGVKVVHCLCLSESGPGLALIPVPDTHSTYRRIGYIGNLRIAEFAQAKVTQLTIV